MKKQTITSKRGKSTHIDLATKKNKTKVKTEKPSQKLAKD